MQNNFDAVGFVNNLLDRRIAEFVQKYPERKGCPEVVMMEELKHDINLAYADYLDDYGENVSAALEDMMERCSNGEIIKSDEFKAVLNNAGEKIFEICGGFMNPPEPAMVDQNKVYTKEAHGFIKDGFIRRCNP